MNSTLQRYRPAVVAVATATLGYSLWLAYSVYNSKPPATLHRSNAVHRRQNPVRTAQALAAADDGNEEAAESRRDQDESASNDQRDIAETIAGSEHTSQQRNPRDGTNLKELLYYIAEDQSRSNAYVHRGVMCNGCYMKPIRGVRWRCSNCADYDLCSDCESTGIHAKTHIFYKVKIPAPFLGNPRQCQPIAYPGKPDEMARELPAEVSKKLARKTKFDKEEIDALYDQFTCLANCRWSGDDLGIKAAIDRCAFDTAFIPLTSISAPRPNLLYDRIFAYYDTDRNGLIGFGELLIGLSHVQHKSYDPDGRRLMIFNGFDLDGDGFISRKDVLRLFRAYYAIQKDITHDLIAVQEEDFDMRNGTALIDGSQPLSAVFTEPPPPAEQSGNDKTTKPADAFGERRHGTNALYESSNDQCRRSEVIENTYFYPYRSEEHNSESDSSLTFASFQADTSVAQESDAPDQAHLEKIADRLRKADFYTDNEEGCLPSEERKTFSRTPLGYLRSGSIWQEDSDDMSPHANDVLPASVNTEQRYTNGQHNISVTIPDTSVGNEILYQVVLEGLNELLDPLFKAKEDLAVEVENTAEERTRWKGAMAQIKTDAAATAKSEQDEPSSTQASPVEQVEIPTPSPIATKDPTMPQFRPNSLKDIIPVPSASRLKKLHELDQVAQEIEKAGGPGRLSMQEFAAFMDSEPGRRLAFVDSWFELGSF